jgi:hypothetical protein
MRAKPVMGVDLLTTTLVFITLIALAVAIYTGTDGRAWFGTHEQPDKLIGCLVRFQSIDWLGASPPSLPVGKVECFNNPTYRIIFDPAFTFEGTTEHFVDVVAHSKGWPVSGAIKKPTAVLVIFESGKKFWADIEVVV